MEGEATTSGVCFLLLKVFQYFVSFVLHIFMFALPTYLPTRIPFFEVYHFSFCKIVGARHCEFSLAQKWTVHFVIFKQHEFVCCAMVDI